MSWFTDSRIKKLKASLSKTEKELSKKKIENKKISTHNEILRDSLRSKKLNFNSVLYSPAFMDILWLKRKWQLFWDKGKAIQINMERVNGSFAEFIVTPDCDVFTHNGGLYYIDKDLMYYNASTKLYCLDFHQSISVPIKRRIPVEKIHKFFHDHDPDDVELALNPRNLKRYESSEFIQKVMQGAELTKIFKTIITLGMITMICTVITLVFIVYKSGALQGVTGAI